MEYTHIEAHGINQAMNSSGCESNSLEQAMVDMQVKTPGCWDEKLFNDKEELYREAVHGLNPLGQGFSICAPYRQGGDLPAGTRILS
jgi:hypothetical protein